MFATMWFERTNVPALAEAIGEDNILFETDFPHPTCLYPDPLDTVLDNWRELEPRARNKILGGNATKLYHL
jgi:predicted TIM-barrel fold metal-dependent hydrolase